MMIPNLLSAEVFAIIAPSFASLSARAALTLAPFLRRKSTAASKSPLVSVRAFLQSIIPAPVIWRNLFTSAALIVLIVLLLLYDN